MLNNVTFGCAKSIALPRKVINLSSPPYPAVCTTSFFYPGSRKKKRESFARRSASSRGLDIDVSRALSCFSRFPLAFFFSPSSLSRYNENGSIDGWGMILCNEGCGIFMPERAGARDGRPPRRIQARHTSPGSLLVATTGGI